MMDKLLVQGLYKQRDLLALRMGFLVVNLMSPSVVLGAQSTSAGFLPPRMTTTQKNAISSPATGLQVYDTDFKPNVILQRNNLGKYIKL
jgi:hypothetical protein